MTGIQDPRMTTIAGVTLRYLDRLPEVGESIVESGYRFTVEEPSESAVRKVRVELAGRR